MKSLTFPTAILLSTFSLISFVGSAASAASDAKASSVVAPAKSTKKLPRAFRDQSVTTDAQLADQIDDFTMDDWIEKNADRLGLTLEPRKKNNGKPDASSAKGSGAPKESDAIKTFIIDKVMPIEAPKSPVDEKISGQKKFEPPVEALESDDAAVQIAAVMKDLKYGGQCSSFASASGFGAWGEFIIDQIVDGQANAMLRGTDDLRKFCPNYDNLDVREKSYVWVKVFAAMAFRESTCQPKAVGKGPNGRAQGLLQLHYRHEDSAASGCRKFDSLSPLKSLRCGMAIVEKQIEDSGRLFSRKTHFGVLRPQGDLVRGKRIYFWRLIAGGLKELPFCQRK